MSIEVTTNGTTSVAEAIVEVNSKSISIERKEVEDLAYYDNNYVVASSASMGIAAGSTVPEWLNDAIAAKIVDGTTTIDNVISALSTYIQNLEVGVNQSISSILSDNTITNSLITSNKAELDGNIGALQTSLITKVNSEEAAAISTTILGAEFSGTGGSVASSFFLNNISTIASSVDAHTTSLDSIVAVSNSISSSVTRLDEAVVDTVNGARAKSSLIVNADNNISGYVAEADGTTSEFRILADTFYVSDGTNTHQPLTIDTTSGLSTFNGTVNFINTDMSGYDNENVDLSDLAKTDMSNVTTIDGGKITTNSVDANRLTTNYAWINGSLQSSDFSYVGGAGFRLKSNAAGTYADPSIYGAYIRGAYISGSTIEGRSIVSGSLLQMFIGNVFLYRASTLSYSSLPSAPSTVLYPIGSDGLLGTFKYAIEYSIGYDGAGIADSARIRYRIEFRESNGSSWKVLKDYTTPNSPYILGAGMSGMYLLTLSGTSGANTGSVRLYMDQQGLYETVPGGSFPVSVKVTRLAV